MSRRIPPLNPLHSFEAAARHGSFTRAATELSVAPPKMPAELVTRLADAIEASLKNPDLRKKFEAQGVEPALAREHDFGAIIGQDLAKWKRVAGSLNITL